MKYKAEDKHRVTGGRSRFGVPTNSPIICAKREREYGHTSILCHQKYFLDSFACTLTASLYLTVNVHVLPAWTLKHIKKNFIYTCRQALTVTFYLLVSFIFWLNGHSTNSVWLCAFSARLFFHYRIWPTFVKRSVSSKHVHRATLVNNILLWEVSGAKVCS